MNKITFPLKSLELNNKQFKIVNDENINSRKIILSCAGSGKTLLIIARISFMIFKLNCNSENFFLATFNRNAAEEMKQRLCQLIGINDVNCGTFHNLGIKLLKKYDYISSYDDEFHVDESQIIFLNFLKSDRSKSLKEKIKYIFIDEFQDINEIQLEIIIELSKFCESLFLVGDDLQNIYSFRGSNNDIILNIKTYFDDLKLEKMTINYRSTPEIINLANQIQNQNKNNFHKTMKSTKPNNTKPTIKIFDNLSKEIKFITESIKTDLKNGFTKKQIAILSRNNMPLYFLEENLQKNKIKNKILNKENYLSNCISLSTIHSAKGLEWDKVYLVGMNDTYFPNKKSCIEEERRLFYVAVTRAKNELIITLNKNDECSELLLELSENLFDCECKLDEIEYNLKNLPSAGDKAFENSVTKIISNLSGKDYIELKMLKIFDNIKFVREKCYVSNIYPDWVIRNDYYAEFGCFIDYLIRRMIADNNKNWNDKYSGFYDKRANEVINSIFLNKKLFYKWSKYYKEIINCIKLYKQKGKLSKKDKCELLSNYDNDIDEIIKNIINVDVDNINVTNKIYVPFGYKYLFKKSYNNFVNRGKKWDEVIYDIFITSKSHLIWGDRRKCIYTEIEENEILRCKSLFDSIYNFVRKKVEGKLVFCNPSLENGIIYGDADLIIDNEILDIKTSNKSDVNIEFTLQLLIYTSLARIKGMKIDKISIFNPLLGEYNYADISLWDKDEILLDYLEDNKLIS